MNYEKMTKRQFLNLHLPNIKESEESELCRKVITAIRNRDNEEFIKCISSKNFDVNERFDTSYIQRENYLGYALHFSNYFAAREILKSKNLKLSEMDKQEILQTLTLNNKYGLLYSIVKRIEESVSFTDYVNAVATLDYGKIRKRTINNN